MDHLDGVAIKKSLTPSDHFRLVHWPVAKMDKDTAEGGVVIIALDNVNPVNSTLAKNRLKDVLNIAPVSVLVVECTRNADGRLSHDVLVGRHDSLFELAGE